MKRRLFPGLGFLALFGWFCWGCAVPPSGGNPPAGNPTPTVISSSPLIAMTPNEYNNTIRDLFGMPLDRSRWPALGLVKDAKMRANGLLWPWLFPDEAGVEKFDGMAQGQNASPFQIERLQKAAHYFSSLALVSPTFFTCKDWKSLPTDKQRPCAWESLRLFAERAWRRPATKEETARLQSFFDTSWQKAAPESALRLVVMGILQTPAFLFRLERGNAAATRGKATPLTSWEMATRLSYFLWDSMPDAVLFAAAREGKLKTASQVAAQAKRMLGDPRARQAVVHFHNRLLGTHKIHTRNPSREQYGRVFGFTPRATGPKSENDQLWGGKLVAVRESMRIEAELFVERTVFDGAGTFTALMSDHHGYVSTHTLPIYGKQTRTLPGKTIIVRGKSRDFVSYGFPNGVGTLSPAEFPKSQRAGLLTLPAVLALHAHAVHPSPVHRGKFILERFACQSTGQPPAAAFGKEPPDSVSAKGTNRERMQALTSPASCAGCHVTLNAPGFAFENFDSLGQWRTEDNGKPVDAKAVIRLDDGETFSVRDGVELARRFASSRQVRNCYTLRWLRYATGVQLKPDAAGVKELQTRFQKNDNVQGLLVAIVTSDLFRYRRAQEGTR